jgi:integrase
VGRQSGSAMIACVPSYRLACALNAEDQRHEVPPTAVFGGEPRRPRSCHIFTQDEIERLLRAASELTPRGSIRPITYTTLVSLIACTGLRISEALKLELSDLTEDGLLIRATKFQKSRLVPLHDSANHSLQQYLAARCRFAPTASTLFVSRNGGKLTYPTVITTFLILARSTGLRGDPGQAGCRLHDLRHRADSPIMPTVSKGIRLRAVWCRVPCLADRLKSA